jgi:hypothetical protein
MRAVWKYPLGDWQTGMFSARMPHGAEILDLQNQMTMPTIWALVDPSAGMEDRHFIIIGTGNEFTWREDMTYIGTFQTMGGAFVFHVFEVFRDAAR